MENNVSNIKYPDVFSPSLNTLNQKKMLLSWGIQDLFEGNRLSKDLFKIQKLIKKYDWKNQISPILYKNSYETLIITNTDKKIIWVNDNFQKMTGYKPEFALNKTARFLQGQKTSDVIKKKISAKISANEPFKGNIINYRKDKTTYKCELKIFPLFSKTKATHFLALEREVV